MPGAFKKPEPYRNPLEKHHEPERAIARPVAGLAKARHPRVGLALQDDAQPLLPAGVLALLDGEGGGVPGAQCWFRPFSKSSSTRSAIGMVSASCAPTPHGTADIARHRHATNTPRQAPRRVIIFPCLAKPDRGRAVSLYVNC